MLLLLFFDTVKPLITNTSEEFIKCRLDNSMSFILYGMGWIGWMGWLRLDKELGWIES